MEWGAAQGSAPRSLPDSHPHCEGPADQSAASQKARVPSACSCRRRRVTAEDRDVSSPGTSGPERRLRTAACPSQDCGRWLQSPHRVPGSASQRHFSFQERKSWQRNRQWSLHGHGLAGHRQGERGGERCGRQRVWGGAPTARGETAVREGATVPASGWRRLRPSPRDAHAAPVGCAGRSPPFCGWASRRARHASCPRCGGQEHAAWSPVHWPWALGGTVRVVQGPWTGFRVGACSAQKLW